MHSGLHLAEIAIYPVKSLGGVYPSEAELIDTGLDHDRAWLVVDEDNMFVTQRQFPKMARIRTAVTSEGLELGIDERLTLRVPIASDGAISTVTIWGKQCEAVDQGDDAALALTTFIGRPVRLVRMKPGFVRTLGSSYAAAARRSVGFADSAPLMLVGQASLDDLNQRLETPVAMDRFRPNLVIGGAKPFAEDDWTRIRVGEATLHLVKECIRCEIPTVDQQSGEKGVEPMETLESYRSGPLGTRFGQKVVHESLGTIRVGDPVTVLE